MPRKPAPARHDPLPDVEHAILLLRQARDLLAHAGARPSRG